MASDLFYLEQALQMAQLRRGFCAPNPSVGAVIVSGETIISRGHHVAAGHPHAEVDALKKLPTVPKDARMFVTLEPCCHYGKTPPCTNAIIEAGIKEVIYAFRDPNPIVAGKGELVLQEAGIDCRQVSHPEIDRFYQSYAYWQANKKPWVTAKLAMTLNGKIAKEKGEPIAITSPALQEVTHQLRKQADGILTTVKTILADDPQLNAPDFLRFSAVSFGLNTKAV